jgi:hypothetical protein
MSPDQAIALMEAIRDKAAKAAPACAMAMGETHRDYMQRVTLSHYQSVPVSQTPSPPGAPPASMTGTLRRSVTCVRGPGGGMVASALTGPHTIYAVTQEWGEVHTGKPRMWLWLKYIGPYEVKSRGWVKRTVDIPARPYVRPSRDDVIANGSAVGAANVQFMRQVFG